MDVFATLKLLIATVFIIRGNGFDHHERQHHFNYSPFILNGQETIGNISYIGAMIYTNGQLPFCSAILISERHALTAAHCIIQGDKNLTKNAFKLVFGLNNLSLRSNYVTVAAIETHENYHLNHLFMQVNDIAVLTLERPVSDLLPICLPKISHTQFIKQDLLIFGWGGDDLEIGTSNILQKAVVREINWASCQRLLKVRTKNLLCTTSAPSDFCQGDSGGPVVGEIYGRKALAGITSGGPLCKISSMERFRSTAPSFSTRITSYLDWIKNKTSISGCDFDLEMSGRSFISLKNRYMMGNYEFKFESVSESSQNVSFNVTIPSSAIITRLERSSQETLGSPTGNSTSQDSISWSYQLDKSRPDVLMLWILLGPDESCNVMIEYEALLDLSHSKGTLRASVEFDKLLSKLEHVVTVLDRRGILSLTHEDDLQSEQPLKSVTSTIDPNEAQAGNVTDATLRLISEMERQQYKLSRQHKISEKFIVHFHLVEPKTENDSWTLTSADDGYFFILYHSNLMHPMKKELTLAIDDKYCNNLEAGKTIGQKVSKCLKGSDTLNILSFEKSFGTKVINSTISKSTNFTDLLKDLKKRSSRKNDPKNDVSDYKEVFGRINTLIESNENVEDKFLIFAMRASCKSSANYQLKSYEDFQKSSNQTTNKIKIALFDKQNETYFVNQSNQEVFFVKETHQLNLFMENSCRMFPTKVLKTVTITGTENLQTNVGPDGDVLDGHDILISGKLTSNCSENHVSIQGKGSSRVYKTLTVPKLDHCNPENNGTSNEKRIWFYMTIKNQMKAKNLWHELIFGNFEQNLIPLFQEFPIIYQKNLNETKINFD